MILQASTLLLLQLKQASTVLVANYQVPNSNNWAGINSHDCYHRLDFYAASPALPIAINVAVTFFFGGGGHTSDLYKRTARAPIWGPRNYLLDRDTDPPWEGALLRGTCALHPLDNGFIY